MPSVEQEAALNLRYLAIDLITEFQDKVSDGQAACHAELKEVETLFIHSKNTKALRV